MEPNTRTSGRPRLAPGTPGAAERWAEALASDGEAFADAKAELEDATALLRSTVRAAMLDGVHYRDAARLANISLKVPSKIRRDLVAEGLLPG